MQKSNLLLRSIGAFLLGIAILSGCNKHPMTAMALEPITTPSKKKHGNFDGGLGEAYRLTVSGNSKTEAHTACNIGWSACNNTLEEYRERIEQLNSSNVLLQESLKNKTTAHTACSIGWGACNNTLEEYRERIEQLNSSNVLFQADLLHCNTTLNSTAQEANNLWHLPSMDNQTITIGLGPAAGVGCIALIGSIVLVRQLWGQAKQITNLEMGKAELATTDSQAGKIANLEKGKAIAIEKASVEDARRLSEQIQDLKEENKELSDKVKNLQKEKEVLAKDNRALDLKLSAEEGRQKANRSIGSGSKRKTSEVSDSARSPNHND